MFVRPRGEAFKMEEIIYDEKETKRNRRRKKKGSSIILKIVIVLISIAVWGGIVYHGYTTAKAYIDTSIQNVQQQNALKLDEINEEILLLKNEITVLQEIVAATDSSLSDTGSLQRNIDIKLEALDERLKDLERSLKILKEAP